MSELRQLKFAQYMEKYGRKGVTNHELAHQGFLRYSHYVQVCRQQYDMNIITERQFLPNGRATNVYVYTYVAPKKKWWKK